MRVSSLVRPVSTVVVREGRRVCVPRVVVAPVVHIYRRTVRQLLSGSVHAYESPPPPPATCVLPDVVASFDGITPHVYRRSHHLFLIFRILLPRMSNLLVFSAMSLCYAYAYAYPPLSASPPPLSITPLRVLSAKYRLQQDVCWRLILGYNRWYLFPLISHPTHCPPFCNVMSILLTYAECAVGV